MNYCNSHLVFVLVSFSLVLASPVPPQNKPSHDGAYVNCNDLVLVQKMKTAGIPYICLQDAGNEVLISAAADPSPNSIIDYYTKEPVSVTNPSSALEIVEAIGEASIKCPEGYVFIAEKDDCVLSVVLPEKSNSEAYLNPNTDALNKNKCPSGFVYNLDKGECFPDKKVFSVSFNKGMFPLNVDEEIITTIKCGAGTVLVPEVDLCLPVNPEAVAEPPKLEAIEIAFIPHPTGCPPGSVYNPEIDHCLRVAVAPIYEKKTNEPVYIISDGITSKTCAPGSVYNADINQCISQETTRGVRDLSDNTQLQHDKSPEKRSASDPSQLSLAPLTSDGFSSTSCGPGEVYNPEVDMCLKV